MTGVAGSGLAMRACDMFAFLVFVSRAVFSFAFLAVFHSVVFTGFLPLWYFVCFAALDFVFYFVILATGFAAGPINDATVLSVAIRGRFNKIISIFKPSGINRLI